MRSLVSSSVRQGPSSPVFWAVMLMILTGAFGCGEGRKSSSSTGDNDRMVDLKRRPSYESPFQIRLTCKGTQERNGIRVLAEVFNVSDKVIGWDEEFSVCLRWRVCVDKDKHWLQEIVVRRMVEQTKESRKRTRFVSIHPGNRLRKLFELTKPFRQFESEPVCRRGRLHPVNYRGYESLCLYRIPDDAKTLDIQLEYIGNWESPLAFESLFGYTMEACHLWHGSCKSNPVVISLQSGSRH